MSQSWKNANRRKTQSKAARRSKFSRTFLTAMQLDDRIVPATFSGTNSTPIMIPQDTADGIGSANPDPSTINVSGLTGVVTSLTVTFNDLYHESAEDIQALLVAPNGTNIYLMANNGGISAIGSPDGTPPSGIDVTFDASATATIPSTGVGTGPYYPNVTLGDTPTSNLPPGTPPAVTTMGLGGLYGVNPNGNWALYIDDVYAFDTGEMAHGWTLSFNYRPNSAPVANPDTFTTPENTTLTVNTAATGVLANDTDANGDPLTPHLVTGPTNGTVTLNPDGTFTYVPKQYFNGTDTFTYKDDDGVVYGNTTTVTINVTHVVQPPIAVNDSYTLQNGDGQVGAGQQYVGPAFGVLSNDVDPDSPTQNYNYYTENFKELPLQAFPPGTGGANNTMTDWSPNLPAGWTLDNNPAGTARWNQPTSPTDPGKVFDGWHVLDIDSWIGQQGDQSRSDFLNEKNYPGFTYPNVGSHTPVLVADGDAYADFESIDSPAAHMYTYAYMPAMTLPGAIPGTLKLNFDSSFRPEDPSDGAQQATVDVSFDGGTTWTNLLTMDNNTGPNAPYGAGDKSRDNQQISLAVNNPAGATAEFRFGYLDASNEWWWAVANISVTADRTNPAAAGMTATEVTGPSHGTLNLNADGSFTYTANPVNYTGPDSFTYQVSNGTYTAGPATVTIQVNQNNVAPVATDDAYTTVENSTLTVGGDTGLLINDVDPDTGGFLGLTTATEVTPPTHGNLTFNADGSFSYVPMTGYYGTDSFTYRDSDSVHTSNTATVTLTIPQTNNFAPVANNDSYTISTNGTLTTTAGTGVLANDTDADGNPLTALQLNITPGPNLPAHGTLTFNADGSFTYVPHQFYYGTDTFTYEAFDGLHFSNLATVTITINQADVPPVANPDSYTTPSGVPLTTTAATGVLANDRDDGTVSTLYTENFDEVPLSPFPQGIGNGPTGNPAGDWTPNLPAGATRDNTNTPAPAQPTAPGNVFYGWNILDEDSWIHEQGDQARSDFQNEKNYPGFSQQAPTLVGSHNHVLVADGDAYDDFVDIHDGMKMTTFFESPSISLAGMAKNSLTLEFDSSYRPESGTQEGTVDVSYDGGATWKNLLDYTDANTGGVGSLENANDHVTLDANNPAGATTAMFRWGYQNASNEWWWAIDNIKVTGSTPNAGATLSAALATQAQHGTVAMNPDGSFTYTPNLGYIGPDSFSYTASDGTHVSAPTTDTIQVVNPIAGIQVNDGSAQRSEVRSLTVTFAGTATFSGNPAAAFNLSQLNDTVSDFATPVPVNNLQPTVSTNALGETVVTLTFSPTGNTNAGNTGTIDTVSTQNGGAPSLNDGRYQLTILASAVDVDGVALNGGAGTNYVSPTDTPGGGAGELGLFRLYGDALGTGIDDTTNLGQMRAAFNSNSTGGGAYLAYLDANNDGAIDTTDLGQLRVRFNSNIYV